MVGRIGGEFILGVNYWPVTSAMYWWNEFDVTEVQEDFARIADNGLKVVRLFLMWQDFQPSPGGISSKALNRLVLVADAAGKAGVKIMPTLFCGHMSGVNWIPAWMLGAKTTTGRFPVVTNGQVVERSVLNFYSSPELIEAQRLKCREVARTLRGHSSVWAYDLGNETSNCVVPPHRQAARVWLETMVGELKVYDERPVTLGLHAEDLEEDRNLWPQDAASYCDFLSMHGYPFYLNWVDDSLDAYVLPFLGAITAWLGRKPVLFQEFGAPSRPVIPPCFNTEDQRRLKCPLWEEEKVALYYRQALDLLVRDGMMGAMVWCYGDYQPGLWERPPLKDNPHERCFGLFRHDKTAKPVARVLKDFAWQAVWKENDSGVANPGSWLKDENADEFYQDARGNLKRLYAKYRQYLRNHQSPGGSSHLGV